MAGYFSDKKRNIIPRWRNFRNSILSGELSITKKEIIKHRSSEILFNKELSNWNEDHGLFESASILGLSSVTNKLNDVKHVAKFTLEKLSGTSNITKFLAKKVLREDVLKFEDLDLDFDIENNRIFFGKKIHDVRHRLRNEPRNAILWVELSLAYSILGLNNKSVDAMTIAVNLYPNNRYVVRSASRLFVHIDLPDIALHILNNSDFLSSDPWQLSTEMAVSSVIGKSSQFVKKGKNLLKDYSSYPFQISELASALATLEMNNGKQKKAKKYFKQSLILPDENSVAQARWAEKSMDNFKIDTDLLKIPRTFEARTWNYINEEEIYSALDNSILWLMDQPFSIRPVEISCSLAGMVEEYSKSIDIAEYGLKIDPLNSTILNGVAFSYASANEIDKARTAYSKIQEKDLNENLKICYLATNGIIHFRSGQAEQGRNLYLESIALGKKYGSHELVERALLYLAREELISGYPTAEETFKLSMNISKDSNFLLHGVIKEQVKKLYDGIKGR